MIQSEAKVSVNKFHRIWGKTLGLAWEAAFHPMEDIQLAQGWSNNRELSFRSNYALKLYHPAIGDADVSCQKRGRLEFVAWYTNDDPQSQSVCLRLRQEANEPTPWLVLARQGEAKTFTFGERQYIALDFYTKTGTFKPVFVKVQGEEEYTYFVLRAHRRHVEENGRVVFSVMRLTEDQVARLGGLDHLLAARQS